MQGFQGNVIKVDKRAKKIYHNLSYNLTKGI